MSDINIELILEEKRLRLSELLHYNNRLDKIILLYITSVYSIIGLQLADKLDLSKLSTINGYSYLLFLFVFLNLSIILHGISQASFIMSLAKFVHIDINKGIKNLIKGKKKKFPYHTLGWDDWNTEIKNVAVRTRNGVVAFWILLVIGISIYSIQMINIEEFYKKSPIELVIIIIVLSFYLLYIIHNAFSLMYFSSKFLIPSDKIKTPVKLLWLYSVIATLFIILVTIII